MAINYGILRGYDISLRSWVAKAMDDVENALPVGQGHKGPCRSIRYVDKQVSCTYFHLAKVETSLGFPS